MRGAVRVLGILFALLAANGCAPTLQHAQRPAAGFAGPRLENNAFVSFDGARLGLTRWDAVPDAERPWAVVLAAHGMNDYANAFHRAGAYWAANGILTLAYDQRGFGRSPQRGVWAPDDLRVEDLRTLVTLARRRYPNAVIAVVGESMGGAVAMQAFASDRPPEADRLVLLSPAVWGFSRMPVGYRVALWLTAHGLPSQVLTPPDWLVRRVYPTDNWSELLAMGRDPLMLWGARSDTLYQLVATMQRASRSGGAIRTRTLWLAGAHDPIIPPSATRAAALRASAAVRTALYANGWHLLTRDHEGFMVCADVVAFLRDPDAPLPSRSPALSKSRSPSQGP